MLESGILEIALGFGIIFGVFYNSYLRNTAVFIKTAPEILVGFILIAFGAIRVSEAYLIATVELAHSFSLALIFLPTACSIAVNSSNISLGKKSVTGWFVSALVLSVLFQSVHNSDLKGGYLSLTSDIVVSIYFFFAMLRFTGLQKLLMIMAILIWGTFHLSNSASLPIDLLIVMGAIVFTKSNFQGIFDNFNKLSLTAEDVISANVHPFLILDLAGRVVYVNEEFVEISGFSRPKLIGREAIELFEIPNNWMLKIDPRQGRKKLRCNLLGEDGNKVPVMLWLNEIRKHKRVLKNLVCFVLDETEHRNVEKRLSAESRRFSSLQETSKALSSSLEMKDVLEAIASAAETITDSDSCIVFALDHANQIIKPLYSTEEVYNNEIMNFECRLGEGLTGRVVNDGKARIQNFDDDSDLAMLIPGTEDEEESLISVPLRAKNVVIGALTLYKTGRKRFDDENMQTLSVFASQAASALETSRLYMKLKESEKVYRSSVDLAVDAIMFVDRDTGKIRDANETARTILDYSISELVSKFVWELHPQPRMQTARQLWQSVKNNGRDFIAEIDFESKEGRLIPASVNASVIATGDTAFIQWVIRDMSEYRKTIDSMRFYQEVLQDLGDPVLITDIYGMICFVNDAFRNIFSANLESYEQPGRERIGIRSLKIPVLDSVWENLDGKTGYAGRLLVNAGRNNEIHKMVHILPKYNKVGKLTHYLWFFHAVENEFQSDPSAGDSVVTGVKAGNFQTFKS